MTARDGATEAGAHGQSETRSRVRVAVARDIARGVRYFELEPFDGSLAPFGPGAHIDLHLGAGLVRQYSLCNGPADRQRFQIAVKREPDSRGGSAALFDRVHVGDVLDVTGPRNHFELRKARPAASESLLLAGGIGITPLLAMARRLREDNRLFRLAYFFRSLEEGAFASELKGDEWGNAVRLHAGLDVAETSAALAAALQAAAQNSEVYVCGPRPFMDLAIGLATPIVGESNVHFEYFGGDAAALAAPGGAFEVRCERSGKTLQVAAEERLVDVLSRHGIGIEVMCEQGVCGTCMTRVISGRPDHRDSYLTPEEREGGQVMLVCCSRSLDPKLVLDV